MTHSANELNELVLIKRVVNSALERRLVQKYPERYKDPKYFECLLLVEHIKAIDELIEYKEANGLLYGPGAT